MNTKGVGGPKLDPAPWAELASQVRQVRADVVDQRAKAGQRAVDVQQPQPEASTLAKTMKMVLAKYPNLVDAPTVALEDAAAAVAKIDTVYAPLTALAHGLTNLSTMTDPARSQSRYTWIFRQLENVEMIRAAVDTAGSALASFPTAQLDALEKALRSEFVELGEQHGDAVRTRVNTSLPIDRTLDTGATRIYERLQSVLRSLETSTPHELLTEPAERNFDSTSAIQSLRQAAHRYPGGRFGLGAVISKLSSRARETGEKIDSAALITALSEHAPESAPWGDVLHAFLRATNGDEKVERRPRDKSRAGLLTQRGQQAWTMVLQTHPIGARIKASNELEVLARASADRDDRALDANAVIALAAEYVDGDPQMIAAVNRIAQYSGASSFIGLPAGLEGKQKALSAAVEEATALVSRLTARLGEFASAIGGHRADVLNALRTALERIKQSSAEDIPALVDHARGVFEAAEKNAVGYRSELASILADITAEIGTAQADLRSKETAFRTALAPIRGALDAAPTPDGMAQTLDALERNVTTSVHRIRTHLAELETGSKSANVRAEVGTIEAEIGQALVQVLRAAARKTKSAEMQRDHAAASRAAERSRAAIVAEPLTASRLLDLPLEDLAAYKLRADVMSLVTNVRRMNLEPALGRTVLADLVNLDADPIRLQTAPSPMASAIIQLSNAVDRVGWGVSPKQAHDWIQKNLPTFLSFQTSEEQRATVSQYAAGLTIGLQRM